jgi:Zn-dependent peptidase ImmA (M78 family)
VPFDEVRQLSPATVEHLLGSGKDAWSGGAASIPLPDGRKLIILNPTHSLTRQNATLMEEISHVFLGHKPSRLAIEQRDKDGQIIARDYNHAIEEEAYSTGAAALVPYTALKRMVSQGRTAQQIARHFYVSRALVEYRIKISRLWTTYRDLIFQGQE